MSGQLWAIVGEAGQRLVWTASADQHPTDHGHAEDCAGQEVFPLDREPIAALGECVTATGEIGFDVSRIAPELIAQIKAEAARRIEAFAPLWRQINDLADPTDPGAIERRAKIDAVRAWSNEVEGLLAAAECPADVARIVAELEGA